MLHLVQCMSNSALDSCLLQCAQLHRYILAEDHLTCPCISCSTSFVLADIASVLELKSPYDLAAASASGMQAFQVQLATVLDMPIACCV